MTRAASLLFGLLIQIRQLLFASLLAGVLWDHFGPQAMFYAGASFAVLALLGIGIEIRTSRS
jgi:hypothetical protein